MVDNELIRRKIRLIERNIIEINKLQIGSLSSYRNDYAKQKASEKMLQEIIETCLDIGKHIIADEKYREPTDYADVFRVLKENKIISVKVSTVMQKTAGFRNVLVHMYERIDPEIVFVAATKRLSDFDNFIAAILKFLNKMSL